MILILIKVNPVIADSCFSYVQNVVNKTQRDKDSLENIVKYNELPQIGVAKICLICLWYTVPVVSRETP